MKKVISIILAMAMVLTMAPVFAIEPVDFTEFGVEHYTVYENDFNTEEEMPFWGTDLDLTTKPTRVDYVDVARYNKAIKVTYDPDYTESKNGWIGVTGENRGFSDGTEAYVMDFDICFPSMPEYGAAIYVWNAIRQGGIRNVQAFAMGYSDVIDENGEVIAQGDSFGFMVKNEFVKEIETETWYKCTQVIDIENGYVSYYIDGECVGVFDISDKGEITDRGYMRIFYKPYGMEEGFLIDNIHLYEARREEVEKGTPYKLCLTEEAFDFEGYTIDGSSLKNSEGNAVTQLGQTLGISSADKMSIVDDPAGADNRVMKWDNTNGDAAADFYLNLAAASRYEIEDKENNAIIFSTDVYVEEASIFGSMQLTWFTAYSSTRGHHFLIMAKNDDDTVKLSFNSETATFPEKEWHNVKWVFTMADHTVTIYLDDKTVASSQIGDGDFVKLDYIRTMMGARTKGVVYFDNWHIYEAAKSVSIDPDEPIDPEEPIEPEPEPDPEPVEPEEPIDPEPEPDPEPVEPGEPGDPDEPDDDNDVANPDLVKRADIYNIDFEGYALDPKATNPEALNSLVDPEGNVVKNPDGQNFTFKAQVSTVKKNEEGVYELVEDSYRTTEVVAAPTGYANADGIGQEVLKVAGNGYSAGSTMSDGTWHASASSQLLINLAGGGDRYPGGTATKTIAQEGDIYVTEFDYAVDEIPTSDIMIAEFRSDGSWGRYCPVFLTTSGAIKLWNTTSDVTLSPKTWHKIMVVAYSETGVVEVYVDGVLAATVESATGSLGYWDSFRLYGSRTNPAVSEIAYYDNMNFYIAQLGEEEPDPEVPDDTVHGIYGDVFQDGFVDDFDWMTIINHLTGEIYRSELDDDKTAMFKAADVFQDGMIDDFDWMVIINHLTGEIPNTLLEMEF